MSERDTAEVKGRLGSSEMLEEGLLGRWIETEERQLTSNSYRQFHFQHSADGCSRHTGNWKYIYIYIYIYI